MLNPPNWVHHEFILHALTKESRIVKNWEKGCIPQIWLRLLLCLRMRFIYYQCPFNCVFEELEVRFADFLEFLYLDCEYPLSWITETHIRLLWLFEQICVKELALNVKLHNLQVLNMFASFFCKEFLEAVL